MREEVKDRLGNSIYLTDERWEHFIENHPELESLRDKALNAARPGARTRDPLSLEAFYYNKNFLNLHEVFDDIDVVVVFRWQSNVPNHFIVTAYPV